MKVLWSSVHENVFICRLMSGENAQVLQNASNKKTAEDFENIQLRYQIRKGNKTISCAIRKKWQNTSYTCWNVCEKRRSARSSVLEPTLFTRVRHRSCLLRAGPASRWLLKPVLTSDVASQAEQTAREQHAEQAKTLQQRPPALLFADLGRLLLTAREPRCTRAEAKIGVQATGRSCFSEIAFTFSLHLFPAKCWE